MGTRHPCGHTSISCTSFSEKYIFNSKFKSRSRSWHKRSNLRSNLTVVSCYFLRWWLKAELIVFRVYNLHSSWHVSLFAFSMSWDFWHAFTNPSYNRFSYKRCRYYPWNTSQKSNNKWIKFFQGLVQFADFLDKFYTLQLTDVTQLQ